MSPIDLPQVSELQQRAEAAGQSHLFARWTELAAAEQESLLEQVSSLDFALLSKLWNEGKQSSSADTLASDLARRARPLQQIVRTPRSSTEMRLHQDARRCGASLLSEGRVAVILVAGGEGTRLGVSGPKGMYPIGPVSGSSLYQILAEQVVALTRRFARSIPFLVMTSHATDRATRTFFAQNHFFGLDSNTVHFLRQGVMPVVDRETGRILMSGPGTIVMNPNGHGGLLEALQTAGSFAQLEQQGIDLLFYHQVDNPLIHVADPVMLGLHHQRRAQVTVKVVAKQSPEEKMGVLTDIDGQVRIIEYSDLTAEDVHRTTADGDPLFWAGNTAIHVFDRTTLQQMAATDEALPYHRAIKKVSHLDGSGRWVVPPVENAIKYERFIFDVLPLVKNCLVMEVERDEEFCPLKNSSGEFSPAHVQQAMISRSLRWLRSRCEVPESTYPIEISPLYALDITDFEQWEPPATWPNGPLLLKVKATSS